MSSIDNATRRVFGIYSVFASTSPISTLSIESLKALVSEFGETWVNHISLSFVSFSRTHNSSVDINS